nr:hypothetical protein [Tanacetum cinerariifolium]
MVAYLSKSDASEGFNQIINFLNGSSIKYALTVNSNIYVSCIKQFWTTVTVKKVNDVIRLQALVDKKKVVVTEATIREALRLADAEGVECLPNEEIFVELAKMGYEKPSTKLTFYKAFLSSQWKFLIHTVLQCMSPKRTSWNEFSSSMALLSFVYLQVENLTFLSDLSTHSTKYTSPTLTQKVFANMRRVRKGFSKVETPLFERMLVEQWVVEEGDVDDNDENVNAGDDAEGDVSATHEEVHIADEEPSIPSLTPPTPPPQPSHDIPLTLQVQPIPPQSPQDVRMPMNLLQEVMDTYVALTRRVEHLEFDKVAQAVKITKLKQRVKKLERRNKGRMIAEMYQDVDVVLEDDKKKDESEPDEVQEVVDVVNTAKIITEVVTTASETITTTSTNITAAEAQVPAATLTVTPARVTAAPSRKRKGIVIRDLQEESIIVVQKYYQISDYRIVFPKNCELISRLYLDNDLNVEDFEF